MGEWRKILHVEIQALGHPDAGESLVRYVELLERWNQAYNLTAVRDPAEMVQRHILDSAVIEPFLAKGLIADVGTGAGLPGIVLAILQPELAFTLIDSNGKKTRFCRQAVAELGLENVAVEQARVEDYRPVERFATVVSRAYASLAEFVSSTRHLLVEGGTFLAMKGAYPHQELNELPAGVRLVAVHPLSVSGLNAERHLVEMELQRQE
ncbi:MAG: 16S rRNA (guanine(527)-N(7))-methyltransferase RsmG [Proteobacteria bacterium]|nr:16S rRNA (guanine(527)-N(7))-methyltransferase RsmG [Pseudomonadota bacterium]